MDIPIGSANNANSTGDYLIKRGGSDIDRIDKQRTWVYAVSLGKADQLPLPLSTAKVSTVVLVRGRADREN